MRGQVRVVKLNDASCERLSLPNQGRKVRTASKHMKLVEAVVRPFVADPKGVNPSRCTDGWYADASEARQPPNGGG